MGPIQRISLSWTPPLETKVLVSPCDQPSWLAAHSYHSAPGNSLKKFHWSIGDLIATAEVAGIGNVKYLSIHEIKESLLSTIGQPPLIRLTLNSF